MWLTGRLAPAFKTIADFPHDSEPAIRNVCRRFVEMCRGLKLFSQTLVAIDGSKFKAENSRDRNVTAGKNDKRQQQIEESIQRYLDAIETADRTRPPGLEAKTARLQEKIARLRQQLRNLHQVKEQLKKQPDAQLSLTDPGSRSMTSDGKGTGTVGYNVQTVVDAKHHLIVEHEVTNVGNDRMQLSRIARAARDAMDKPKLKVLADRRYFSGVEILACDIEGIAAYIPKPLTSASKRKGLSTKQGGLHLHRARRRIQIPSGWAGIYRFPTVSHRLNLRVYWASACPRCPLGSLPTCVSYVLSMKPFG